MARSEEAEAFFYAVYQAIQEIPYGKVTSYAHIARLVGTRACCIFLVFPTHPRTHSPYFHVKHTILFYIFIFLVPGLKGIE